MALFECRAFSCLAEICPNPIKCLLSLFYYSPSVEQRHDLSLGDIVAAVSAARLHPDSQSYDIIEVTFRRLVCVCLCVSSAGGGVQPAVCAPRAPVQEAVCGPLPGLRQERQRRAGRLCGAGTAQDGGPDAGLRPVHISKSPDGGRDGLEALVPSFKLNKNTSTFT